ncbi:DUF481 domain-containing protein [Luminiphilus sp.]|nr:DUF481 domain-containing protein [Luminiphilus sp.]MDB0009161.1 DUF481 domain-containing protein [Luminiphilus sp.]
MSTLRIHSILFLGLLSGLFHFSVWASDDTVVSAAESPPARIVLMDQSVILGEVIDIREGEVVVETQWLGEVSIDLTAIMLLESDQEIELLTKDQNKFALSSLQVVEGVVVLEDKENLAVDELYVANPEDWEEGRGYSLEGRVTSAVEFLRGNTSTDQFNADFETILRSQRDRITFRGDYAETSAVVLSPEYDALGEPVLDDNGDPAVTKDSTPTIDNWAIVGKYDYFLSNSQNYLGVNLGVNADRFADIERRAYIGPYFGRKLFVDKTYQLDAELGVSYVETDFIERDYDDDPVAANSPDNYFTGINLNFTGETELFDGALNLYLRQTNILNVSDMEKSIYRTTFGLRFPLLLGLEVAAEASADYDGGAAPGKEKLDEAVRFRIGYNW